MLRLASFLATPESALAAVVSNGSMTAATITLRNYAGNTNYTFSCSGGGTFTTGQVTIHSFLRNVDYSQALLR